ncbi:NINE protein [Gloeocapsopsis dulcis]|nr:NINE protein [Gloeocapsopsis dulcis]WNN90443.1 NINE protein [Gloeocapsopsis dulcis]
MWCLCFLGICGGQRFYTGHVASGIVYLFTFGFLVLVNSST